jgi:hypothetical protein
MVKLLKTPLYDDFFNLVASSKKNIKLCSPFIKSDIVDHIYEKANSRCSVSVITSINLMSFYKKSSIRRSIRDHRQTYA